MSGVRIAREGREPVDIARPRGVTLLRSFFRFSRRWPVMPVLIILVFVIGGILSPWVSPHDPIQGNVRLRNTPPMWYSTGSSQHVLGTDQVGRDVLSRIIHGARISLMVAAIAVGSGTVIGTFLGLVAGYAGGQLDELILRIVDVWAGLPFILVALVTVVVLGQSVAVLMGLLAMMAWASGVRNVRGEVLSLKTRDYVSLARLSGASTARILFVHILPGVVNTVVVIATLRVGGLILAEATLSFLGAGIPPPTPSWGAMVAEGRDFLGRAWWISFFPGVAIFFVVMGMNFLGDWLRDHLDPRLRQL